MSTGAAHEPSRPSSPCHYQPPKKTKALTPPFSPSASIYSTKQHIHPAGLNFPHKLIKPHADLASYLTHDLATPRINQIHHLLWLAGLPRPARPLHRQRLLSRKIVLTESANEHLVWSPGQILLKPVPEYLLDYAFWQKEICPRGEVHSSACGLLLSYAWLISSKIDFQIAQDERILAGDVTWAAWTALVREFLDWFEKGELGPDGHSHDYVHESNNSINRRYHFGELRLSRLNSLYRLTPSTFSPRNLVFGFMSSSTWYRAFFERNFSWFLTMLVYMSVLLSAMQVGLATEVLHENGVFQRFCRGFALASILFTVVLVGVIVLLWGVLFCYHFGLTVLYHRRVRRGRGARV
ncbi:hypothetical protein BJY04DRAFT_229015 [Aspergillus karnatakaensis]|uniref:uncharacterized protein n=1 Tax=Aspergillus karnatakaensis TaxID=1810916 RepID=UPI003CCD856F